MQAADPTAQVVCPAVSGEQSDGGHARLQGLRGPELLRVTRCRAWIILGLSGLAVTQPLLDLFGRNPDGSTEEPPELLAAVNGTLAGVVGGYERAGDGWRFMGYVADFYAEGANRVDLYEVERSRGRPMLHAVLASP